MKRFALIRTLSGVALLLAGMIALYLYEDALKARFGLPQYSFLIAFILISAAILSIVWRSIYENEVMKDEFVTIVTHKFRTPLTAVSWIREALEKDITSSERSELLVSLNSTCRRLEEIVDFLINYAKSDEKLGYAYQALSLRELVENSLEKCSVITHQKKLSVSIGPLANLPLIIVDAAKIQFVIDTLISNAVTYTPPGGAIGIFGFDMPKYTKLVVEDTGIGISATDISRITRRFFRTARATSANTEGLGLSLHMSKKIMERHKGKLLIESKGEDKGTAFALLIPKR